MPSIGAAENAACFAYPHPPSSSLTESPTGSAANGDPPRFPLMRTYAHPRALARNVA
jgi:hypothetical protein